MSLPKGLLVTPGSLIELRNKSLIRSLFGNPETADTDHEGLRTMPLIKDKNRNDRIHTLLRVDDRIDTLLHGKEFVNP